MVIYIPLISQPSKKGWKVYNTRWHSRRDLFTNRSYMRHLFIAFLLCITTQIYTNPVSFDLEKCEEYVVQDTPEVLLLARLLHAEARGEPYEGQLAAAQVVVNRMRLRNKTLREVVYRKGQFDGVTTKAFYEAPSTSCLNAARAVLLHKHYILPLDVIYFHNPRISTDTDWTNKLAPYYCCSYGNHNFYHQITRNVRNQVIAR